MRHKLIISIIAFCLLLACKDDPSKNQNQEDIKIEEPEKKELIVQFDFKTNQEDEFRLMLNNIQVDALQKKNIMIRETVAPSSVPETITGNFGENISNNLVFNLGNSKVKEVEFIGATITYGKTAIDIRTPEDFYKYFVTNRFIEADSVTTKLVTKRVDGNHFPGFSARRRLINALKN